MPTPTHAWGFEAHKFIMERAIGLLPAEMRPFFEQYKSTLVERAIDPDTWQVAGFDDQEDRRITSSISTGKATGSIRLPGCLATTRQRSPSSARSGSMRTARCRGASRRCTAICGARSSRTERRGPFGRIRRPLLFRVAHALRERRPRAISCGVQLRRTADRPARHSLALRGVSVRALPRSVDDRAEADRADEESARLHLRRRAAGHAARSADPQSRIWTPSAAATSTTMLTTRRSSRPIARCSSAGLNESIAASAAMIAGAWEAAGKPAVPLNPRPTAAPRR